MTLSREHPQVTALAVDPSGTFAYAATTSQEFRYTVPGISSKLIRIRLSDFVQAGTLTLKSGENPISTILIDPAGRNAYLTTYGDPNTDRSGQIVQVDLKRFARRGVTPLEKGVYALVTSALSPRGNAAYFGTLFGSVEGFSLPDLKPLGSLALDRQSNAFHTAIVDAASPYVYFGTASGGLLQINVKLWEPTGSLSLLNAEGGFAGADIDRRNRKAYWVTVSPGDSSRVIGVDLAGFKQEKATVLLGNEKEAVALFVNEAARLAYVVVQGPPAAIVRIAIPSMTRLDALPLPKGFGKITAVTYDARRRKLYAAMGSRPVRLVQVDMTVPVPPPPKPTLQLTDEGCSTVEGCNESLQSLP